MHCKLDVVDGTIENDLSDMLLKWLKERYFLEGTKGLIARCCNDILEQGGLSVVSKGATHVAHILQCWDLEIAEDLDLDLCR